MSNMRIYTQAGDLAFETFTFPDGQPHFKLEEFNAIHTRSEVTIESALKSFNDVALLLLATDVLRNNGFSDLRLDIRYLLGARMDRAISTREPFTLELVARLINGAGFSRVRILDVHSDVALKLIRNSVNVLPHHVLDQALQMMRHRFIVIPDRGARKRVQKLFPWLYSASFISCTKVRDVATGRLLKFEIENPDYVQGSCLIVDDICDGGGTFVGLAKELRKAGARKVDLFVTHGIFSKGLPLKGIDKVFTTNSYDGTVVLDREEGYYKDGLVVLPVSMKEMA